MCCPRNYSFGSDVSRKADRREAVFFTAEAPQFSFSPGGRGGGQTDGKVPASFNQYLASMVEGYETNFKQK